MGKRSAYDDRNYYLKEDVSVEWTNEAVEGQENVAFLLSYPERSTMIVKYKQFCSAGRKILYEPLRCTREIDK